MEEIIQRLPMTDEVVESEHSILIKKKDKTIIQEMISKVDVDSFTAIMNIASNRKEADKEVVNWYLEEWAKAKYEFYLLFGHNLTTSKTMSFSIPEREMSGCINNIFKLAYEEKEHFKFYKPIVDIFSTQDFIQNKCPPNEEMEKYIPDYYKPGMKLSKFFSTYFNDPLFDIEVSKVLQNKKIKGNMTLSIDPIDYLTCSINKYDWRTCASIYTGAHACQPFANLLDETSTVCYKCDGKLYDYNICGYSFKANNKQFRSFINIHKENMAFSVGRVYPNCDSENNYTALKDFCQEKLSNLLNVGNMWYTTIVTQNMDGQSCHDTYGIVKGSIQRKHRDPHLDYMETNSMIIFLDPVKYVCSLTKEPITKFYVGVDRLRCGICGEYIKALSGNNRLLLCDDDK